jgi:hypothetical protein
MATAKPTMVMTNGATITAVIRCSILSTPKRGGYLADHSNRRISMRARGHFRWRLGAFKIKQFTSFGHLLERRVRSNCTSKTPACAWLRSLPLSHGACPRHADSRAYTVPDQLGVAGQRGEVRQDRGCDATPCPADVIRRFIPPEPISCAGGVKPYSRKIRR